MTGQLPHAALPSPVASPRVDLAAVGAAPPVMRVLGRMARGPHGPAEVSHAESREAVMSSLRTSKMHSARPGRPTSAAPIAHCHFVTVTGFRSGYRQWTNRHPSEYSTIPRACKARIARRAHRTPGGLKPRPMVQRRRFRSPGARPCSGSPSSLCGSLALFSSRGDVLRTLAQLSFRPSVLSSW